MRMPYHFDALLPTAERFASPKFRRVAWKLNLRLLDWQDAVELVAFVEAVGLRQARYIFHWRGLASIQAYHHLRLHVGDEAQAMVEANLSVLGADEGLAILRAMQDGGWSRGKLPQYMTNAFRDLRKRGNSIARIAKATGLTVSQVETIARVRKKVDKSVQTAAYGALAL